LALVLYFGWKLVSRNFWGFATLSPSEADIRQGRVEFRKWPHFRPSVGSYLPPLSQFHPADGL
jgi:hypothetical protein